MSAAANGMPGLAGIHAGCGKRSALSGAADNALSLAAVNAGYGRTVVLEDTSTWP